MVVIAIRSTFIGVNRSINSSLNVQPIVCGFKKTPPFSQEWESCHCTKLIPSSDKHHNAAVGYPMPVIYKPKPSSKDEEELPNSASFKFHVGLSLEEASSSSCYWWFSELADLAQIVRTSSLGSDVASGLQGITLGGNGDDDKHRPYLLSWTVTKGQVWITLTDDNSPYVVIVNRTSEAIVVAESSQEGTGKEDRWAGQFISISPGSTSYLTLSHKFNEFPKLNKRSPSSDVIPLIVVGKKIKPTATAINEPINQDQDQTETRVLNCFTSVDEVRWSNPLKLDCV